MPAIDWRGVVLHRVQHTGTGTYGLAHLENLIRRGTRENLTWAAAIEHSTAHVTGMHRFVTAAAPRHYAYLARPWSVTPHSVKGIQA